MNKYDYFTSHGLDRANERFDGHSKEIKTLAMYAKRNGICYHDIPTGKLRAYLASKQGGIKRIAKIYRGFVFIFTKNSKRLITCYILPEKYKEEYDKTLEILKIKKKKSINI